ncbi:MAG: GlsB/YeaQ/YmgE family stress response membrane protein [Cyclobacteriaceae bacterium]
MELVAVLLTGGASGWLGGMIYRGSGLGLFGNIVIGVLGGWLGYWLLSQLGINLGHTLIGTIFTSAIGAIVILFLAGAVFKKKT